MGRGPAVAAIRLFREADWPGVWAVLAPVFRAGETFPHDPQIRPEAARQAWVEAAAATFVATAPDGSILGTYYLRPNQPALGAHVANAGYVVAEAARGQGLAHGSSAPTPRPMRPLPITCRSSFEVLGDRRSRGPRRRSLERR